MNNWYWTKEGDLVVLHDWLEHEVRYNESGIRLALQNVQSRRKDYGTKEAWEQNVRLFSEGGCPF